ncbi:MAG: RagB/SusD family nutrient uptake outer membrane protein [Cyclobacteriaceae bacterium]
MLLITNGLHDALGDLIFVPWGNNSFKFADNPTDITLDDMSVNPMPIGVSQPYELKLRNARAYGPGNIMLIEWTYMYFMNDACNRILEYIDKPSYSGNADSKKAALKAWAYFWKGYAYSRIGSMYIAGLIVDTAGTSNGNYVTNAEIISEATKNFDASIAALNSVSDVDSYANMMSALIPGQNSGPNSIAEFIRNINTMKARNALVNIRLKDMTSNEWTNVMNLANAGIQLGDGVFIMRTTQDINKSYIDPSFGWSAAFTSGSGGTFFVSERLIQDFDLANDHRFLSNFDTLSSPVVNKRGRGLGFGTRWNLEDAGNTWWRAHNSTAAKPYVNVSGYGMDNIYIAGTYEENQLLIAEAKINSGDISGGLGMIDGVRNYQGANLAPLDGGTINTVPLAMEEIRKERRIALLFRGLSFYDARRMGITDDKSLGGGRHGAWVLSADNTGATIVNTNASINYNYLPYFDVPQNELDFNAQIGIAPVKSTILK